MTDWHQGPRAAFDLETTSVNPQSARIVTASVLVFDAAGQTDTTHEWLANPGVPIPPQATAIHGITTEEAERNGLPSPDIVNAISEVLSNLFEAGIPVIAFNASYDFSVLHAECLRWGIAPLSEPAPIIDPYILDKQFDRYRRGKRTLQAQCEHYGITLQNAHSSTGDALATRHLADALADTFADIRIPATDLHAKQIIWAKEQAASYQAFLRRTRPDATVSGEWPVSDN